jgi:hypothetical protein
VQRVLDLGVAGIQIPHIESEADAERARQYIRFHPQGSRGVCRFVRAAGVQRDGPHGVLRRAKRGGLDPDDRGDSSGVANARAICQSPGHDVVFVGPYDLSQALGIPGQVGDARVTSLVELDRGHVPGLRAPRRGIRGHPRGGAEISRSRGQVHRLFGGRGYFRQRLRRTPGCAARSRRQVIRPNQ